MLKLEDFKSFEVSNLQNLTGGWKETTLDGVTGGDATDDNGDLWLCDDDCVWRKA